jgi:hypothetical protein
VNTFPTNCALGGRNHAVKQRLCLTRRPLILHGESNLRLIPIPIRMERNAPELGAKDLVTNIYFLLLVMQFIMLHKHLRCRFSTAGSNSSENFGQLDDSVRG